MTLNDFLIYNHLNKNFFFNFNQMIDIIMIIMILSIYFLIYHQFKNFFDLKTIICKVEILLNFLIHFNRILFLLKYFIKRINYHLNLN